MRGKVHSKERKGKFIYRFDFFCLFLSAMKCMSHHFKLCANTFLSAVCLFFFFLTTRGLQGAYDCKVEGPVWLLKKKKTTHCVSRFP